LDPQRIASLQRCDALSLHPALHLLVVSATKPGMAMRRVLAMLTHSLFAATLFACSSIGPPTVERDRIDYGSAIADSWKQQTLLNIVKLRYGDFPVFLEIAQVIAGYQIESSVGAGFNATNNSSFGPLAFFGGSALAQGKYTDRPTLIYAPLTGNDFLKKLMTPIPPSAVLFMLQSGYAADLVLRIAVNSINGVGNESRRGMSRAADPDFARLGQLLRELQLDDAVQIRIERPKEGDAESTMIVFPRRKDAETVARSQEIRDILRLKPGLQELRVYYGGYSGKDDEISMMTRSMLQIMLELATIVQVPPSDVASGRAAQGAVEVEASGTPEPQAPALLNILGGDARPRDAYAAIQYGGRWFWIADTDIRSKYTFGMVMLLFSISDTGVHGNAPVVTVPAN
jgi:hypothetical protein